MEQRDLNSSDSSEPESVSPAPSLPSPPILPLQVAQQAHRTTNFFIDNILRPDFGCRKEPCGRERAHGSGGRERVHPAVSRPSNAATASQDSNCSTDSSSSSAASSASPKQSQGGGGGGAAAADPGSGGVKAEERTAGAAENSNSSLVVLNGTGTSSPENQPMLWPAWVYCTRYSDRPSSGKTRVS